PARPLRSTLVPYTTLFRSQAGTPRRAGQDRQVERVLHREILEAEERRPLDPAGREDGRLVEVGAVGQGRRQEILVLQRVALGGPDEGGVVEHVLTHRGPQQEADVE